MANLFFIIYDIDIASYADNNTPYIIADNIDYLIINHWNFHCLISMVWKSNPDKCHLHINSNENVTVHVGEYEIENSKCKKLLGIKLDWKLNFDEHISDVWKQLMEN